MSDTAVLFHVAGGGRPLKPTDEECNGENVPSELWEVAEQCWCLDPQARPTMDSIHGHLIAMTNHAVISAETAPDYNASADTRLMPPDLVGSSEGKDSNQKPAEHS